MWLVYLDVVFVLVFFCYVNWRDDFLVICLWCYVVCVIVLYVEGRENLGVCLLRILV